jgi:hypothetical protein
MPACVASVLSTLACCFAVASLGRQVEVIEWIMKPHPHGFQKRFHLTVSCDHPPCEKSQQCLDAQKVLHELHEWMSKHFFHDGAEAENEGCQAVNHLDGFALTLFRAATEAAKKFVAEGANAAAARWLDAKLKYVSSDLLKFANAAMRMSQFLASLSSAPDAQSTHQRCKVNVYEMAHALWMWRRQVHIHWCYYTTMEAQSLESDGSEKALAKKLEQGIACKRPHDEVLEGLDLFKFEILHDDRSKEKFSTKDARVWVRNKKVFRGVTDMSEKIKEACDELVTADVLVKVDGEEAKARGRATHSYKKRSWTEVDSAETAAKECKRLGLRDVNFE